MQKGRGAALYETTIFAIRVEILEVFKRDGGGRVTPSCLSYIELRKEELDFLMSKAIAPYVNYCM